MKLILIKTSWKTKKDKTATAIAAVATSAAKVISGTSCLIKQMAQSSSSSFLVIDFRLKRFETNDTFCLLRGLIGVEGGIESVEENVSIRIVEKEEN